MTLSEFMDMWTRGNRTVVICKAEYYDDMFDLVDMLNEGHAKIEDCRNWMECAVLPYITQFCAAYYLHPKYASSKVENFFIGDTYVIVWCDLKVNVSDLELEDIKTEMCDSYCCKRKEWKGDPDEFIDTVCTECPLTKL